MVIWQVCDVLTMLICVFFIVLRMSWTNGHWSWGQKVGSLLYLPSILYLCWFDWYRMFFFGRSFVGINWFENDCNVYVNWWTVIIRFEAFIWTDWIDIKRSILDSQYIYQSCLVLIIMDLMGSTAWKIPFTCKNTITSLFIYEIYSGQKLKYVYEYANNFWYFLVVFIFNNKFRCFF